MHFFSVYTRYCSTLKKAVFHILQIKKWQKDAKYVVLVIAYRGGPGYPDYLALGPGLFLCFIALDMTALACRNLASGFLVKPHCLSPSELPVSLIKTTVLF